MLLLSNGIFIAMRKILLFFVFVPLIASAQSKFGYYSHEAVLSALPEYAQAIEEFNSLKARCEAEIEHNEKELTRMYVAFLDGQQDFPEPILRKRQKELQQMVDNSALFRDRLKDWLLHAKDSLTAPSEGKVNVALERVCVRRGLAYAIDCDETRYRYINPAIGEDITEAIVEEILNPYIATEQPVTECAEEDNEAATPVATDIIVNAITDTVDAVASDTLGTAVVTELNDTIKGATTTAE